jgi:hypothetical protein
MGSKAVQAQDDQEMMRRFFQNHQDLISKSTK